MEPKWKWRPAAKFDIGSVARFSDTGCELDDWVYGILKDVLEAPNGFWYEIHKDYYNRDGERFGYCQIQLQQPRTRCHCGKAGDVTGYCEDCLGG